MFPPHPCVKVSIVGSLRDQEVACSASDRQGSNFESCVWRTVSSQSSHHPQEVLLAQFSLYVHKGGLKPNSFHFLPCIPVDEITHSKKLPSGDFHDIRNAFLTLLYNARQKPDHPSLYRKGTNSGYVNDYGTLSVHKPEI